MDEVVIERLAADGSGVAGELRVPFALPGERWTGTPPVLVAASSERTAARCPHFGVCGGCGLQHASDGLVAEWKRAAVVRALAAHGLAAEMRPIATSPERSRRRAVFGGRRLKSGAMVGFHGRRSDAIVAVADCTVLRPEILAARPVLAELTRLAGTRARAVRLTVTHGPAGLDVDVGDGRPMDATGRERAAGLAAEADLARLSFEGEVVAARRPAVQVFGTVAVLPPPGAFLQATAEGEAALVGAVRQPVGGARRVADLFAGCGTFALPLAATAEVAAFEGEAAMVAALLSGWKQGRGLKPVSATVRDLFRRPLIAAELDRFEAVVIDPPRAGAEAQMRELARSRVGRVASVSCNPASFARDAAILKEGGFRLDWVLPVDQFRWSGHVEIAAQFSR